MGRALTKVNGKAFVAADGSLRGAEPVRAALTSSATMSSFSTPAEHFVTSCGGMAWAPVSAGGLAVAHCWADRTKGGACGRQGGWRGLEGGWGVTRTRSTRRRAAAAKVVEKIKTMGLNS